VLCTEMNGIFGSFVEGCRGTDQVVVGDGVV